MVLIARGAHAEAIRTSGLTVEDPDGRRIVAVPVVTDPAGLTIGADDVVLLAMKSQDTVAALDALRRRRPADHPDHLRAERGGQRAGGPPAVHHVYAVCVMCPAGHLEPGVIQGYSVPVPGLLDIGRYPDGTDATSAARRGGVPSRPGSTPRTGTTSCAGSTASC